MELTLPGFWTALVIISTMSIFLFIVTKSKKLYNSICPNTIIFCGVLILFRVIFPYEIVLAKEICIPWILPVVDSSLRHKIIKFGSSTITIWTVIFFVWMTLVVVKVYDLIRSYIKMQQNLWLCDEIDDDLLSQIKKMEEKAGLKSNAITYKMSKLYDNTFIFGITNATIVLPPFVLSLPESQFYMVLLHEWSHFKRKDGLIKIIIEMSCRIFWWLPFLGNIKRKLYEAMEIRADWNVIRNMHEDEKTQYMLLLYELSKMANCTPNHRSLSNKLIDQQISTMEKRFGFINERIKWGNKNTFLLLITLTIFAFSYFVVLEPNYIPNDGAIICESSCYLYEQENGLYDVYMDGIYMITTKDINFIHTSDFQNIKIKIFKEDKFETKK